MVSKFLGYLIGVLVGIIVLLGGSLWVFIAPMFQTDEMLAQIRVENVVQTSEMTCYIVSLEVMPGNDESRRDTILQRQRLCGDFLGLGYEFTLPNKSLLLMKKPGIMITNVVAFEKKQKNMTGNIPAGKYNVELIRTIREYVGKALAKTPMVKSVTYDIKAVMKKPQAGAIITYKLEPLRQQVVAECVGCVE